MSLTSEIRGKTRLGQFLLDNVNVPKFNVLTDPVISHAAKRWRLIGTAFDFRVRMGISIKNNIEFIPRVSDIGFIHNYARGMLESLEDILIFRQLFPLWDKYPNFDDDAITNLEKLCTNERFDEINTRISISIDNYHDLDYFKTLFAKDISYLAIRKELLILIDEEKDIPVLSEYAIKLAYWERVARGGRSIDQDWKDVFDDDILEVEQLYNLWKEKYIMPSGKIELNPGFEFRPSADADLIVGTHLVDWKVYTKPNNDLKKNMAQLAGYAILSYKSGKEIETCSIYFARHGLTLSIKTTELLKCKIKDAAEIWNSLLK